MFERTQRQRTTEHSLFILLHYNTTYCDISTIFVLLHFNREFRCARASLRTHTRRSGDTERRENEEELCE